MYIHHDRCAASKTVFLLPIYVSMHLANKNKKVSNPEYQVIPPHLLPERWNPGQTVCKALTAAPKAYCFVCMLATEGDLDEHINIFINSDINRGFSKRIKLEL